MKMRLLYNLALWEKGRYTRIYICLSVLYVTLNSVKLPLISLHVNALALKYIVSNCAFIENGFLLPL